MLNKNHPQETDNLFELMANSSPVLLWIAGKDSLCYFFNQTWLTFTGRTLEQEWGIGWAEGIYFEDFQFCMDTYIEAFNARKSFEMEYRLKRHDGEYRWILDRGVPRLNENGEFQGYVGSCVDISDIKNYLIIIEDQKNRLLQSSALIQSTKLAALGEMAGGIAHEINSPLTIINGNAYTIIKMIERGNLDLAQTKKCAENIEDTVGRISKIVKGLLSFARDDQDVEFSSVSIKNIIDQSFVLCSEKFKSFGIEIKTSEIPDHLHIPCNSVQIMHVLLNIFNNSFDAVKDLEQKWIRIDANDKNENIEIKITDSGIGIPIEIRNKIMDPFFTSKKVGEGTGLGLSISLGIIKKHQGNILLDSECPNTCFIIQLPKVQNVNSKTGMEQI